MSRSLARVAGIVAVAGLSLTVWAHLRVEWTALIKPAEADRHVQRSIAEYTRHLGEPLIQEWGIFDDARGSLSVAAYADGCVLIKRRASPNAAVQVRLIPDVATEKRPDQAHVQTDGPTWISTATAGPRCDGRCVEPHPGLVVRVTYGARRGSWIEVIRTWADACQHVQWYDTATGVWDSYPDGRPRVTWRCCTHPQERSR